jgi:hypothetical protein
MANTQNKQGATWADLFLALIYAGTALLFLVWISGTTISNPPAGLQKVLGSGWSWAISACGGAVITLIFRNRLSKLVLTWTGVLIVALASAAFFLQTPRPHAPERWKTTEGFKLGDYQNEWDVKFDGSAFSCAPDKRFGTTECRALAWGNDRAVQRDRTSDDNPCTFFGTVAGDTIRGTYDCKNGGPWEWHAKIE